MVWKPPDGQALETMESDGSPEKKTIRPFKKNRRENEFPDFSRERMCLFVKAVTFCVICL